MKDMFGMMKQVQAMQEKFATIQAEMEALEVEGLEPLLAKGLRSASNRFSDK